MRETGLCWVNKTSIAGSVPIAFQGPYSAMKAATASMSEVLGQELQPFDIKVVDPKTGMFESKFFTNATSSGSAELGDVYLKSDSLYSPGKEQVEKFTRVNTGIKNEPADQWAETIVKDLSKRSPPIHVGRGGRASRRWMATT